jgi:hypothetical protein
MRAEVATNCLNFNVTPLSFHIRKVLTVPNLQKFRTQRGEMRLYSGHSIKISIFGGGSHPKWHAHQGEDDPKFWLSISHHGKPTLRGQPLLVQVRELLKIP